MARKNWQVGALAALFALAMLCSVRAEGVKATDEGEGAEFQGKTVEMKDKAAPRNNFVICLVGLSWARSCSSISGGHGEA